MFERIPEVKLVSPLRPMILPNKIHRLMPTGGAAVAVLPTGFHFSLRQDGAEGDVLTGSLDG